jgi:hypothetical protein
MEVLENVDPGTEHEIHCANFSPNCRRSQMAAIEPID